MKVSFISAVLAALPAWVNAVAITNSNFNGIEVGKSFEITWSDAVGPVSLTLKDGPSDNLKTVSELTSGETGTSYTWVPSASGTFALEINDGTDVNYSQQFEVSGGSASGTSASSTVSQTSTSSAHLSSSTVASITSSATLTSSETSSVPTSSSTSSGSSSFVTSTSSGSISAVTSSSTRASSSKSNIYACLSRFKHLTRS
ncbi:hypothetical protein F4811DRAFT_530629 [Daldinia bambusicola]|nr:hypothetical protein F4811DRAFT_530629 [Daldinia bambusicola]